MKLKLAFISTFLLKISCSTVHSRAIGLLYENISNFRRDTFHCALEIKNTVLSEDDKVEKMNDDFNESSLCTLNGDYSSELDKAVGSSKVLSRDHFSNLPDYLIISISSYLDFKISQGSLIETSKHFNSIIHKSIEEHLRTFSPYFVFRERWMNRIMNFFLSNYFNEISDIKDERFYDALELLNIKHIKIEKYFNDNIKVSTADLILKFLFELVYGPNEGVSISSNHWKQNFLQRLLKHEMPRCTEYYLEEFFSHNTQDLYIYYMPNISMIKDQIIIIFDFFRLYRSKHRNEEDLFDFFTKYMASYEIVTDLVRFAPELEVFSLFNFHDKTIPQDKMIDCFWTLCINFSFSQSFLDRFPSNSDFLFNILQDKSHRKEARLISALYTKLVSNDNDPLKYMWTRDLLNPFDMQVFIDLSGENIQRDIKKAISELALCSNLYLIHIEIFRIMIQSGIYDFSAIDAPKESLQYIICTGSVLLLRIFLDEVQTPINSILLDDDFKYVSILSKMRHFRSGYEKTLIFIETLKTDDPISLLFICQANWLISEVSDVFVDKFNLKKRYTFDGDFSRVIYGNSNSMNFGRFNGQTLTFKQIIDSINVEGLIDIFTSNPASLDIDDVNDPYPAPISFSKFINQGVYEPVY